MAIKIHFISGLPRSGSTLLACILRQNPVFHAGISGPVADLVNGLLHTMGRANETSIFLSTDQRQRIIRAVVEAYYLEKSEQATIIDTNRAWCALLPVLKELFPKARVLCCIRNPAWVLDSVERQVQHNPFTISRLFNHDTAANVYTRTEAIATGLLGQSMNNLQQAWFGEDADRQIAVRYESLTERPHEVVGAIYEHIGESPFEHDFDHLYYEEREFDEYIGLPGLHKVLPRVQPCKRKSILPLDLFIRYDRRFWELPGFNPKGVTVL